MVSKAFADDVMVLLTRWVEEDPADISNDYLGLLYRELMNLSEKDGKKHLSKYLATDVGRYKLPRMKAALGSSITLLREKDELPIISLHDMVDLLYKIRGPNLTAVEFLAELMNDESSRTSSEL